MVEIQIALQLSFKYLFLCIFFTINIDMTIITTPIISQNPYGNYQVGNTKYPNKMEAAYRATQEKLPITWDFHNAEFSKINWQQRPPGNIQDLYRQRAQQLRDTYDYIIVYFSGGSDSWTVLNSFLSNGIHVDEIRTNWAMDQRKFQAADPTNRHEVNIMSEFEYAILPVLDHVRKTYPRTNIVINDYSTALQKENFDEELIHRSNHWQNISSPYRLKGTSEKSDLLINRHRSVAGVYGFEKLKMRCVNKKLYAFFSDTAGGAELDGEKAVEFFFSTPKFSLIPVMQAHYLRDELLAQKAQAMANKNSNAPGLRDRGLWNDIYLRACYPDYNPDTFQTDKALGTWLRASDVWMHKYNPTFFDSWRWTYDQYFKNLDDNLLDKMQGTITVGLKALNSPNYLIDDNFDYPDFVASSKLNLFGATGQKEY